MCVTDTGLVLPTVQSLVEQLEGDRLENEIVEEMQNLVEKFKVKEASELALRQQLAEMEKLLQVRRRRRKREGKREGDSLVKSCPP